MTTVRSLFVICALTAAFLPLVSGAQTLESARESYERGDYTAAEEELKEILAENGENNEALALLREIELQRRKEEAVSLTERALIEINSRNFQEAYGLLERAVVLDPENSRARELYLSIHEILQVEGETLDQMLERREEELSIVEEPATEIPPEEERAVSEAVSPEEEEPVPEEPAPPPEPEVVQRYDRAIIRGGPVFSFARSNNLDYLTSNVGLFGLRLDGRYYFNILQRGLGLSFDYTGSLLKLGGEDLISFGTHRMNFSARYRMYLFERDYGRLTLGARLNYHLFVLNNREPLGVYSFTRVYGPSLGLFFEDPVVYRFWKREFLKQFGLEGDFNYLVLVGKGKQAPRASEWSLSVYYDLKRYRFNLGYRRYTLKNDAVRESYNDIELTAGYRF
jgi:tetratricopeptide (TPR) repeat protein